MPSNLYDKVVSAASGTGALASLLGVSPPCVSNWRKSGFPPRYCKRIEAATGVSVTKLRPDDWRDFWPEARQRVAGAR